MNVILVPLISVLFMVLNLYLQAIFFSVIISWLVAFNIININNRVVYLVRDFLYRITEPAYRQIRRFIPIMGGIDISPLFLILAVYFVKNVLAQLALFL